ncbi:MAG: hypothetical protein L0154_21910 [Chloroflexi bacterium]|nr:hypothetical protein [Chloroflexota bacterium]
MKRRDIGLVVLGLIGGLVLWGLLALLVFGSGVTGDDTFGERTQTAEAQHGTNEALQATIDTYSAVETILAQTPTVEASQ